MAVRRCTGAADGSHSVVRSTSRQTLLPAHVSMMRSDSVEGLCVTLLRRNSLQVQMLLHLSQGGANRSCLQKHFLWRGDARCPPSFWRGEKCLHASVKRYSDSGAWQKPFVENVVQAGLDLPDSWLGLFSLTFTTRFRKRPRRRRRGLRPVLCSTCGMVLNMSLWTHHDGARVDSARCQAEVWTRRKARGLVHK